MKKFPMFVHAAYEQDRDGNDDYLAVYTDGVSSIEPGQRCAMNPYSRTRSKQVVRVLSLVRLMQGSYWSAVGAARKLNVSPRTIQRDWAAMRFAGIKLDGVQPDGVYRLTNITKR